MKTFLERALSAPVRGLGFEIFARKPGHYYVPDYFGNSAPKRLDIRKIPIFGELAKAVISEGRTLLYYDRLYMLYQALENLARRFGTEGALRIAEVGVYKGGTSNFLIRAAAALNLGQAALDAFDTFDGHSNADIRPGVDAASHVPHLFGDADFAEVSRYLGGVPGVRIHKGRFQDTCGATADSRFHLAHLDVDLYAPTAFALDFFDSRLVPGGALIIDDYGVSSCPGVRRAVEEFLAPRPHYFVMHPLTEQCILVKMGRASAVG